MNIFKKIIILFLVLFSFSCSKKETLDEAIEKETASGDVPSFLHDDD